MEKRVAALNTPLVQVGKRGVKGESDENSCCHNPTSCFAGLSQRCGSICGEEDDGSSSGSGGSTKWTHLTQEEHICQPCIDEFAKPGRKLTEKFSQWKALWLTNSRREPTHRMFAAEELTNYWLQCTNCSKWRALPRASDVDWERISDFICSEAFLNDQQQLDCDMPQDTVVDSVSSEGWLSSLGAPGLLRSSPAVPFLNHEYFNDEVGLSPAEEFQSTFLDRDEKLEGLLEPFYVPTESGKALCLRPDVMEYDEIVQFPEYASESRMYLGLRNLIIALWNINPKDWLTVEKCSWHTICRGMIRIYLVRDMERILWFLSTKGIVNLGLLPCPSPLRVPVHVEQARKKVVVIGAGISGLSAARQLHHYGCDVRVLEAKKDVGGRICDELSLGVVAGKGGQLVTGIINNPLILMCLQRGLPWKNVGEACPLLDMGNNGEPVSLLADRRVDLHFNALLDAVADWRKNHPVKTEDPSLEDQLLHMHRMFLDMSKLKWSQEEERLFQFQLGNVEFSCGVSLSEVSARNWDQNEQFAQFYGPHALLNGGGQALVRGLSEGLNIQYNCPVSKINHSEADVSLVCKNGTTIKCDKVIVSVSLAVLQYGNISFNPELPKEKIKSLTKLGAGTIEKVAVKFPYNFWKSKIKGADYFGVIPVNKSKRGLFNMFYDFSEPSKDCHVLMSYVCGESVNIVNDMSDKQVVAKFRDTLKSLFPNETVPEPIGSVVSHWARDPHIGMSYSFVAKGGTGQDYSTLSQSIDDQIFFAGEATNEYFPQTMTGAYLSGIREAGKVINSLKPNSAAVKSEQVKSEPQ